MLSFNSWYLNSIPSEYWSTNALSSPLSSNRYSLIYNFLASLTCNCSLFKPILKANLTSLGSSSFTSVPIPYELIISFLEGAYSANIKLSSEKSSAAALLSVVNLFSFTSFFVLSMSSTL